jgi:uncharacterized membrane protein
VIHERATPERLNALCDAIFAVLITLLVLELRPPEIPTFEEGADDYATARPSRVGRRGS